MKALALLTAIALALGGCVSPPAPADPLIYRPTQPIHYPIPR